jgi:hypothetical protein
MIATGAAGNVRAAMADLEIWFGQMVMLPLIP